MFHLKYPAPGNPALAARIGQLLDPIAVAQDQEWGFDHGTRTLFPADAFACMHWHSKEHCGLTLEEIGPDPEPSNVHFIVSGAQRRNLDRKLHEFDVLVTELDVRILAPAHGTVITDPRRARWFLDGLRQVSAGV